MPNNSVDTVLQVASEQEGGAGNRKVEKIDEIQQHLRRNKTVFYGYPILVMLYILVLGVFIIQPAVQHYFDTREKLRILEDNHNNIRNTVSNLNSVLAVEDKLDGYQNQLNEYIPEESRLARLIDEILRLAGDFSLEREIGTSRPGDDQGTIERVKALGGDLNSDDLLESISSGEVKFNPRFLDDSDVEATLLTIDILVKGEKDNFLNFIDALGKRQPLVNVVGVYYEEISTPDQSPRVSASIKLESYTLKSTKSSKGKANSPISMFDDKDERVLRPISSESFAINPEIDKVLGDKQ